MQQRVAACSPISIPTSATEFYLATGDIYATQQLPGHADVSTTANIYVQGSPADLEEKLRKVWGE